MVVLILYNKPYLHCTVRCGLKVKNDTSLSVVKVCRVKQNRIFFVGRLKWFAVALNLLFPVVDVMTGEIAQNQSMSCTLQRLTTFVKGHFVAI